MPNSPNMTIAVIPREPTLSRAFAKARKQIGNFVSGIQFISNSGSGGYGYTVLRCKVFHMLLQSARNLICHMFLAAGLLLVAGCSTPGPVATGNAPLAPGRTMPQASDAYGNRAAEIAMRQVGAPYRYGGASTNGFDCSGLVHYSYAKAGKSVPRTTAGLWQGARPISYAELQTGDVLFFRIEGKMSHVGMYLGNGRFVHAPASGRSVSVDSLDSDFYSLAFIRGGRL
jgi:murein DD-endopeptidase